MKRIAITLAVGLFAVIGCRSDERSSTMTTDVPSATPPAGPIGGGPRTDAWSRDGVIDRMAHARCVARERCGAIGKPTADHVSFSECVEVARADLRGSFGASTCDGYDHGKLEGCARELSDAACGTETKLTDNCV